eukprot:gene28080-34880_t
MLPSYELLNGGFPIQEVSLAGFNHTRLAQAGYTAFDMLEILHLDILALKKAGFGAVELKNVGASASQMKSCGFTAKQLQHLYTAGELNRAGYSKSELKHVGAWPHDGEWKHYNQYWSCCFSLDHHTKY